MFEQRAVEGSHVVGSVAITEQLAEQVRTHTRSLAALLEPVPLQKVVDSLCRPTDCEWLYPAAFAAFIRGWSVLVILAVLFDPYSRSCSLAAGLRISEGVHSSDNSRH